MATRRAAIGDWADVFDQAPPDLADIATEARGLIRRLHPGTVEVARPGDRAVTFGFGPRKMKEGYAYLMPQRAWVNLGLYQGADLPDPDCLLEGAGKSLRHIKLRSPEQVGRDALAGLVAAAVAERASVLGREI